MADSTFNFLSPTDLAGFSQQVQANDPYGLIGKGIAQWQPDYSVMSPTATGLTAFGRAFTAGLLQNYAQNRASDQLDKVVGILPQLKANPYAITAPEGVDTSAFNLLKGSAILKDFERKSEQEDLSKKFQSDLMMRVLGKKADVVGEQMAYGSDGSDPLQNPNSPDYKLRQDIKAEEDAARKEIATLPAVQKLNTTSTALSQIKNIKDLDTASSDIPFATIFIGGLDGSVVREGEYARVQGANPFLAKYKNLLEGALNGSSTLGVEIKRQMFNELAQTQKGLLEEATRQAGPRLGTALTRGAKDPKSILPFDPEMKFDSLDTASAAPFQVGGTFQGQKIIGIKKIK